MSEDRIDVAICLDARMLDAAIVLAASIKAHARQARPVRLHALTDFASPELAELAAAMNDATFELVPLAHANVYGHFPIRDHITAGTYLRFLLPELLPDVDRIIYLDTDIIVHRNLEALYDTPLEGHALAAMPDWSMLVGSQTWPTYFIPCGDEKLRFIAYVPRVLGLECDGTTNYFNCGVMVLDLAYWRAHDIAGRTIAYLTAHPELYYMDQDALNYICDGHYARLDQRWNCFANCSFSAIINVLVRFTRIGRRWEALRAVWRRDPWVIHFAGAHKPWVPGDPHTVRDDLWWHYAGLSPMRDRILATYAAKETARQRRRSKVPDAQRQSDMSAPMLDRLGIPAAPLSLGVAGLVPFWGLSLTLLVHSALGLDTARLDFELATYAAIIVSFLGGIRWGFAVRDDANGASYAVSVVPSLVAWAALAAPGHWRLVILGVVALALGPVDLQLVRSGHAPAWFGRLRLILSTGAGVALLLAAFG